ncbi:MAG: dTDP-glucose 4,6-dehydratase [Planctomyces sp.]|nr:dTDP-glucose 4,6-dehydratase [Planctomyces sp.]
MNVLVTGGCGFIGSALVRNLLRQTDWTVVNIDCLTYAGHVESLEEGLEHPRHHLIRKHIADREAMDAAFAEFQPMAVMHLAAESHVDRSLTGPAEFIHTNILGTYTLLEAARSHFGKLDAAGKAKFRFLHVSTDEVFGALGPTGQFTEETRYDPHSPYSASKASADHLARAWHHSYGLPVLVTNCSNNYGPFQFPEKLIPVVIRKALAEQPIPVYAKGENVRDWLHVDDHVSALLRVLNAGQIGETYAIGGRAEVRNIDLVQVICEVLDELRPRSSGTKHAELISFVSDRPGHDFRYAIDCSKIERELGWKQSVTFREGMRSTVEWYLANQTWVEAVLKP